MTVLLKTEKLTPRNYEAARSDWGKFTAVDARYPHHPPSRRWDGSGYPDGLVGDKFLSRSRCFKIIDITTILTVNVHINER